MINKLVFSLTTILISISFFSIEAKEVDWKVLQGLTVTEKKGPPKLSKELKVAMASNISIKGFMIPLDYNSKKVDEFLLVPFIPSCMHVPPPPANQVVLVKMEKGKKANSSYFPIKVSGVLSLGKKQGLIDSSFSMVATGVKEIK
ncbi:MAG: DUF3299 domain-containing protein [Bdellovibrionota bacterium]|nr:DUF3299 domain-containing protein [Bdellovibrionota bacterium]